MTANAYGWTATPHHARGPDIDHRNGEWVDGTTSARQDLARCIEDAARYAEACKLAATLHRGENIFTGQVDDIHRLLALLSGDGTP